MELSWLSYIRVLSTKRELRDGGSFQQAKHDSEPEDWMTDDEVEHAEYDNSARERRQSRKLSSRGREKQRRIQQGDGKKCQQPSLGKQI
jgi:hypothetical protein